LLGSWRTLLALVVPVAAVELVHSCLLVVVVYVELFLLDSKRWLIDLESNGCPLVN
jgi:hypothetical protein